MVKRRSETELARADLIDIVRSKARLESRIALRHRLNEVEAEALTEFEERVSQGLPFRPIAELEV